MSTWTLLRTLLFFLAVAGPMLPLAGCNTISGIGQDIGAAGRGIEEGAETVKPY